MRIWFFCLCTLFAFVGCQQQALVVSDVNEREANEIIVLLASKDIPASKTISATASPGGAQGAPKWSIFVGSNQVVDAMALLNQSGLPRIRGTNLLELFGKQGLMTSDKEDTIRYQAGLAEQIAGTIRKIDGIIDADVQISFPNSDSSSAMPWEQTTQAKITAAVYIKHQGILDDPNSHLVMKVKRLVSGSIQGLDVNDVTIISDRARFSDLTQGNLPETLTGSDLVDCDEQAVCWTFSRSICFTLFGIDRFCRLYRMVPMETLPSLKEQRRDQKALCFYTTSFSSRRNTCRRKAFRNIFHNAS